MSEPALLPPMPGQRLARGVCRLMRSLDHAVLTEFTPARGLRVDVIGLGPKGEVWIVECKSGRADFRADRKWQGYLEWCDRYFWAVDGDFPTDLLPGDTGLIQADAFGAEIIRMAPETRLAAARRARLQRDIARAAALRLQALTDPEAFSAGAF
ncbi:DNA repair protein MmcB-related protein [Paracoccus aestuarii]|uniref:DNA repair protein MmcB-related protein n=1 Tax=Paracoccus aestuarii TaxID=453842 RepID=A0A418ZZR9_9RHOB|nr:MmcB family DNA repair protein [Paracoccus aestuarii]RJL06088.1 DNA repair protein MmcB-related protein [Paracoccus aestuarii]WCQ98077.1 MmcB family DNA repair protein [Paracoccus aestuarii]